ncbi:unnamed protein product [Caenorhabditis sp. 36 PRJEB53466]|nr:unnamed protein product [Caenorhabditis sp. 36 PRJEB53466]
MQIVPSSRDRNSLPKTTPTSVILPTIPSKEASSQSGWDYWSRVYSSDEPFSSSSSSTSSGPGPQPPHRDIRISDMLQSETLVRAKLLFLNVPGLPIAHKNIIRNLVRRELREDISMQDVIVAPGKWFLNFYRPEDALRVLKLFNGYAYRNHSLVVRFCYPDGTYGDESALAALVECSKAAKGHMFEQKEIVQDSLSSDCWTWAEYQAVHKFEREIVKLLQSHAYLPYHNVLQSMRTMFAGTRNCPGSLLISESLSVWPTGFIRMFSRCVKVVANTMCLSTSPYYTQRIHDSAMQGGCSVHRNSWEPFVPEDIRCDVQLRQYAHAFLTHFGPQHLEIDAPIRLLAQCLRGTWPKTGRSLAVLFTEISLEFVIINSVLYLSACENHRDKIIDNLAAFQDDCSDVYYLPLSCVSKEQKVKVVDYEDL